MFPTLDLTSGLKVGVWYEQSKVNIDDSPHSRRKLEKEFELIQSAQLRALQEEIQESIERSKD